VDIVDDNLVEAEEIFVVVLEATGNPAVTTSRNCAIVRIQDPPIGQSEKFYLTQFCKKNLTQPILVIQFCMWEVLTLIFLRQPAILTQNALYIERLSLSKNFLRALFYQKLN